MSHDFRELYHFNAATTLTPGIRSAGYSEKCFGSARYVSTPTGANKVWEVFENPIVPRTSGVPNSARPFVFAMVVNAANGNSAIAGECLQGIEIGSFNQLTPWQTTYAFAAYGPVMQLRYNYTVSRFEVLVWDGDSGTPPEIVPCTINPTWICDTHIKEFVLDYRPSPVAGVSRLNAYLNGQLALSHSSAMLDSVAGSGATMCEAGYFITNGSGVGSSWVEAGFYGGKIYQPFEYANPRNP